MYAKAPIRGTAERESGPSFKTPLRVHFYARRLPTPHEVGSIGLYKRPTSRLGEDGYPKARGILKGIPAWVPSRGPLGGSPRGIVTSLSRSVDLEPGGAGGAGSGSFQAGHPGRSPTDPTPLRILCP